MRSRETGGGRCASAGSASPASSPATVELWVEDEGPGLSNTGNLFVPFFTTKPGGSGIGLVLSRQIAEAHGGSLLLENRERPPRHAARRCGCPVQQAAAGSGGRGAVGAVSAASPSMSRPSDWQNGLESLDSRRGNAIARCGSGCSTARPTGSTSSWR